MVRNEELSPVTHEVSLTTYESGELLFPADNVACFTKPSGENYSRIFLKAAGSYKGFNVNESLQDISAKLPLASIILDCPAAETAGTKLGVAVRAIGAYFRQPGENHTTLYLKDRTAEDEYFMVTQTPAEIQEMVHTAREMKPGL